MADFFSQFQVHPPQDFSLGGFQPASPSNTPQIGDPRYGVGGMGYEGGMGGGSYLPIGNDPRLSPLPQPWQQGPVEIPHAPSNGGIYNPTTNPGGTQLPPGSHPGWDNDPGGFPGGLPQGGYGGPLPQSPYQNDWTPRGPNGLPDPRIISGPAINGGNAQLPPNYFPNLGGGLGGVDPIASHGVVNDPAFDGWYQQQKASGRNFEDISNQMMAQKGIPGYSYNGNAGPMPSLGPAANMGPNGPTYTNGQGQATDQFGNPMGTSNQTGQVNLSPLANGIGQPMNPSQQSGMVLMRSPDGLHMQNVPQAHVDHYTGLGATQVTGPQLTGSSYGGSI